MPQQKENQKPTEKVSKENSVPASSNQEQPKKTVPEKTLFSWKAKSRPFKRRNKDFWVTVVSIAAISGLILFFVEGYMPVLLIVALVFLSYILNTVEPEEIEYKITNKGVKFGEQLTLWQDLSRFWFSRRFDEELLVFEANSLTGRLELVINVNDKDTIKKSLKTYVTEEEIPPSQIDKASNWFSKRLPGNS